MNRILLAVVIVVLAALPVLPVTPAFWITHLNYIGLASLVVLGLVLLTGVGGLTSFGQAAFVGMGAYTTAWLTTAMGWSPWLALLAGLAFTFVVSYLLGTITLRLSGHYLPLGTIAWGLSLYYLFGNLQFLGSFDGIAGIEPLHIFGVSLADGRSMYYLAAAWPNRSASTWRRIKSLFLSTPRCWRACPAGCTPICSALSALAPLA
jgi:branched-chain amino acid transport system permease protein